MNSNLLTFALLFLSVLSLRRSEERKVLAHFEGPLIYPTSLTRLHLERNRVQFGAYRPKAVSAGSLKIEM